MLTLLSLLGCAPERDVLRVPTTSPECEVWVLVPCEGCEFPSAPTDRLVLTTTTRDYVCTLEPDPRDARHAVFSIRGADGSAPDTVTCAASVGSIVVRFEPNSAPDPRAFVFWASHSAASCGTPPAANWRPYPGGIVRNPSP